MAPPRDFTRSIRHSVAGYATLGPQSGSVGETINAMSRLVASLILVILLQTGCDDTIPSSVRVLDLKTFRVEAPGTWQDVPGVGYDSQVGSLTDGRDVLRYDYGWYSYRFRNETSATHLRTPVTIDGRSALVVRPRKVGKGVIGLYVEVDGQNRLSLTGRDIRDEETAIRIFQSVKF